MKKYVYRKEDHMKYTVKNMYPEMDALTIENVVKECMKRLPNEGQVYFKEIIKSVVEG